MDPALVASTSPTGCPTIGPLAIFRRRAGHDGSQLELRPSAVQASLKLDDDTLVVGHMADSDGAPLFVPARKLLQQAEASLQAEDVTDGEWTLIARRRDELLVRTDVFGGRPMFWRRDHDRTQICEDIWPLAAGRGIDPIGVADMLLVGHHLGTRTLFDGVSATVGNSLFTFGGSSFRHVRFDWPRPTPTGHSLDDAADALERVLERLYAPYAHIDDLLMPLSGGLDSRVLLALAIERGVSVEAWTIVMRPDTFEERIARSVADLLDVPHVVSHGEAAQLQALAPQMLHATSSQLSLAHAHVFGPHLSAPPGHTVAAFGAYGDLFCGGSYLGAPGLGVRAAQHERIRALLSGVSLETAQARLPGIPGWADRIREIVADRFARAGNDPRRSDLIVVADRVSRFNAWGPIASRRSFDSISPFLNQALMQTAYGMPERWHRESRAYKRVITRRWPALAALPWAKTGLPLEARRIQALRARIARRARRARGQPDAFTEASVYEEAFSELAREAVAELSGPLSAAGIDLEGLCADLPPTTYVGQQLRLNIATCHLAFREARAMLP